MDVVWMGLEVLNTPKSCNIQNYHVIITVENEDEIQISLQETFKSNFRDRENYFQVYWRKVSPIQRQNSYFVKYQLNKTIINIIPEESARFSIIYNFNITQIGKICNNVNKHYNLLYKKSSENG